eukprot:Nitzschia sp. Nitz4//scaffold38_size140716//130641//131506//NITZ4_003176-RA/size140716-augustus-gene-0.141-mRNA-1//-1//CDS//3329550165//2129//frame0
MKIAFLLSLLGTVSALDLVLDDLECDASLPAYALENGITMTCNGENRCTLGDSAVISGDLIYQNLEESGVQNHTGYTSAKLNLMTLDYQLFDLLPFNFCGDWISYSQGVEGDCPGNGQYHFEIPYTLPTNDDYKTWFATGWAGVSYLKIYTYRSEQSALLAHCKVNFKTYVTSSKEDNWYTLPSAATTTMFLFGIALSMFLIVLCLACRPAQKHPTDDDYVLDFSPMKDTPSTKKSTRDEEVGEDLDDRIGRLSMKMEYPNK